MVLAIAKRIEEARFAEVKRLCRIWKLVRKDGTVKRFTNASGNIEAATSFAPFTTEEFTPSEISANRESSRRTVGLDAETDSIASIISDSGWTIEDARIGLFERVRVDVWDIDWLRPQSGWLYHAVYYMVDVTFSGESISFRLATIAQLADAKVGRIYTIRCDATFGDSRCGKDLTGLSSGTKTVTAVGSSPRLAFESDNTSLADNKWTDGVLTWLTGTNAITGVNKHQVKLSRQTDGVMELWTTTPYDIEVGDTFSVVRGCNKLFNQHCRSEYNNGVNHRGFRFVAGFDKTIAGPDAVV